MFSSATSGVGNTLSGLFDIQYRVWSVTFEDTGIVDGGQPFAIGSYRHIDSLVVRNEVVLIEGAVADMMNGGLGFRNHTAPQNIPYGATWIEDLTWVEPVTECVDTNLTFQFFLSSENGEPENITLIDNGGFTNLDPVYPNGTWHDRQNPDLRARAYKAAYINNVLSAVVLNVTFDVHLQKMNSSLGKTFGQGDDRGLLLFSPKMYTTQFSKIDGGYLSLNLGIDDDSNKHLPLSATITSDNFTEAATICQGWGGLDIANYTNTGVYCGYIYGAPRRTDGGDPLVFEPNKNYTQNLYVCATGIKQNVKTVTFLANSTTDITQLHVTNISDKVYADNASQPLWAIEHSNWTIIDDVAPAWGMVANHYENNASGFDTLRAEQFWLPAIYEEPIATLGPTMDSLASLKIFQDVLYSVYGGTGNGNYEFSGSGNIAMNRLWLQLSGSSEGVGKIINLIWTELTASSAVGIKAVTADSSSSNSKNTRMATPYTQRIGYTWAYAIPGLLVLLASAFILLSALFFALTSRFSIRVLRQLLNQTATGRVATNLLHPTTSDPGADTKAWANTAGKTTLSFAAVEKEKSGGTGLAATTASTAQSMAAPFPGMGSKGGEYIMMKDNPH
jgi:hypothetical protein